MDHVGEGQGRILDTFTLADLVDQAPHHVVEVDDAALSEGAIRAMPGQSQADLLGDGQGHVGRREDLRHGGGWQSRLRCGPRPRVLRRLFIEAYGNAAVQSRISSRVARWVLSREPAVRAMLREELMIRPQDFPALPEALVRRVRPKDQEQAQRQANEGVHRRRDLDDAGRACESAPPPPTRARRARPGG
jgi:hypothetical protein